MKHHETEGIRRDLERLARAGADVVRGERSAVALHRAVDEGLLAAAVFAAVALLGRLLGLWEIGGWPLAIGALGIAGLWLPLRAAAATLAKVPERRGLLVVDQQLGLADRLVSAREFVNHPAPSGFMEAAVQDAEDRMRGLGDVALDTHAPPFRFTRRGRRLLGAVLLLLAIGFAWSLPAPKTVLPAEVADADVFAVPPEGSTPTDPPTVLPAPEPDGTPGKPIAGTASPARQGQDAAPPTEDIRKSEGKTGSGRSADATASQGTGQARGTPSSQGQATEPGEERPPRPAKEPKKQKEKPPTQDRERKPEDQSGHTAGRGAASGSNKSPAASEWSSKDHVQSEEDDDLEHEEEVDDEFDISDARGGLQPQLRDRKPPVNRDLGIGFGNQKDPDANGRGGPGEQKKSRGVASLVLGVPVPDHVKGKPGPGKTKITQERVQPQDEDLPALQASARSPRSTPPGHIGRPELWPWMQDMLQSYYSKIRSTKEAQ